MKKLITACIAVTIALAGVSPAMAAELDTAPEPTVVATETQVAQTNNTETVQEVVPALVPAAQEVVKVSPVTIPEVLPYNLVIWKYVTEGVKFPQTLVAYTGPTSSTDVRALDSKATQCGTTYQSDLYANNAKTDKLIAFGTLAGGSGPGESWYGGSYQSKFSNSFTTAPCGPTTVTVPTLVPTPPTCEAVGSLPFLGNPAAQNPNGYEFPGQGYRVYISPAFTGAGTYMATIQKVGAGFDPAFPYGTKVTGVTSQTLVVLPAIGFQTADSNLPCYNRPEVPTKAAEAFVSHTDELSCDNPTGFVTTSTITFTFAWNEATGVYDESHVTTDTYERISLSDAEVAACVVEPPVVVPPVTEPPVASEPIVEPVVNRLASAGFAGGATALFVGLVLLLGAALITVARVRKS